MIYSLLLYIILILISFPNKIVSLFVLTFIIIYYVIINFFNNNYSNNIYLILILLITNALSTIIINGLPFIQNYLLFFLFISPILLLITQKKPIILTSNINIKRSIEWYLLTQICFCLIAFLVHFNNQGFDTNFGDKIAGTFRNPLTYKGDASNVIYCYTIIIILFFYSEFKEKNNIIFYISIVTVFFASVNHLIISLLLAYILSFQFSFSFLSIKRTFYSILGLISTSLLYLIFQPSNFNLILLRVTNIFQALYQSVTSIQLFIELSTKSKFIFNFFTDFHENFITFLLFGVGAGAYSSRAALFFIGDYVQSFPFINISHFTENNTLYLWHKMISAQRWDQGAYNYPYSSLFSIVSELGLLFYLILSYMFIKKFYKIKVFNNNKIKMFLYFLFISSLIDNYFEYYQSFLVVLILYSINIYRGNENEYFN